MQETLSYEMYLLERNTYSVDSRLIGEVWQLGRGGQLLVDFRPDVLARERRRRVSREK